MFYSEVINELSDDEEGVHLDLIHCNVAQGKNHKLPREDELFSNLTNSEKAIQIGKIYQQSRANMLLFQVRAMVAKSKQQISEFLQSSKSRFAQLKIFNQHLQDLDQFLRQTMGSTDQRKLFTAKRVLDILKTIGKLNSSQDYQRLINSIKEISGVQDSSEKQDSDQQKTNKDTICKQMATASAVFSHQTLNQTDSVKNADDSAENLIKKEASPQRSNRRSLSIKICLEKQQKPCKKSERLSRVPYFSLKHREKNVQFEKVLQKVDQIHENHLKTWEKHNEEMKQFEAKRSEIKQRHSAFHNKMLLNRRIIRHASLREIPSSHPNNFPKVVFSNNEEPQEKQEQLEEPRRLSSSLQYLENVSRMKMAHNEHDIRFRMMQIINNKKKHEDFRTQQNQRFSFYRGEEYSQKRLPSWQAEKKDKGHKSKKQKEKKSRSKSGKRLKLKSSKKDQSPTVNKNRQNAQVLTPLNNRESSKSPNKKGKQSSLKVNFDKSNPRKLLKLNR